MTLIRCNISIAIADGSVLVSVRVPRDTSHQDIDAMIGAVVGAFASVEDQCPNGESALDLNEHAHGADAFGFFLQRRYSDPDYPDRLTSALREMTHSSSALPLSAKLH
ncbi:MAG TPA: hypothetical protein VGO37_01725 [Steroidobacteraceae bacterium]|jgi:hypothetical protein|nr:hypothetical protein [Steroidobacteraceae bacterium]